MSHLPIDAPRAIAALTRFIELTAADRRDRATASLVDGTTDAMADGLAAQGRVFRKGLEPLKAKWQELPGQVWPGDWIPALNVAQDVTRDKMRAGLFYNILEALVMGGGHLVDDIGVPLTVAFNLDNPLALAYATVNAAEQVRKINDATKEGINRIIVKAVENGTSYTRVQKELMAAYEFSRKRARNIAVYEIGDAYEAGRRTAVDEMRGQGLVMVKSWLSAGDAKVRDEHRANQAAGWIGIDEPFPGDGAQRPPTDPGCRCAANYKMA